MKIRIKIMLVASLIGIMCVSQKVDASFEDDYKTNVKGTTVPLKENSVLENFTFSDETQSIIDEVEEKFPGTYGQQFDTIIQIAKDAQTMTAEELNEALIDSAEAILNQDTENVIEGSPTIIPQSRASFGERQIIARAGWNAGIGVVKKAGYPNTAKYMEHAKIKNNKRPGTHIEKQTAWTKKAAQELPRNDFPIFKKWIMTEKKTLTTSGTAAFNTGDLYYALHYVNWTVTYIRNANGGCTYTTTITDVYDFEKSKVTYNGIAGQFAANYAVDCTYLAVIAPYNIIMTYTHYGS